MDLHAGMQPVLLTPALLPQAIAVNLADDISHQRQHSTNAKVAFMTLLALVAQSLMRIRKNRCLQRFIRILMPPKATVQWPSHSPGNWRTAYQSLNGPLWRAFRNSRTNRFGALTTVFVLWR